MAKAKKAAAKKTETESTKGNALDRAYSTAAHAGYGTVRQ
jgi:hypothetical protein